jgi:hypothetical protein
VSAVADEPLAAQPPPVSQAAVPVTVSGGALPDPEPTPVTEGAALPPIEVLESWSFLAGDPSTGAAVLGRVGEGLHIVRPGDRVGLFEVAAARTDRVVLRPLPGASGLENVREVWLLRDGRAGESRIRVVRLRDDSSRPLRSSPGSIDGSALPEGAKSVRPGSGQRGPR